MSKQIPVPNELGKPFWDAAKQKRLEVQNCTACNRLQYPPNDVCNVTGINPGCGSGDHLGWKEVTGRGHIMEFFVVRDSRIKRMQPDQPFNIALVSLDEDPNINFLSNLPGTAPGDVHVGDAVEVLFEPVEGSDQLIPEWVVMK